jgi:hypothetical protein
LCLRPEAGARVIAAIASLVAGTPINSASRRPIRAAVEGSNVMGSLGAWHRQQRGDAHGAGRFAKDCDLAGISAEGPDILLHPFECGDLISRRPKLATPSPSPGRDTVCR